VAGAYKATSIDALEVELKVQPLDLHMEKLVLGAATRCALIDTQKSIERRVAAILRGRGIRGRTPAHWGPLQNIEA
jgi:hypothetical protein